MLVKGFFLAKILGKLFGLGLLLAAASPASGGRNADAAKGLVKVGVFIDVLLCFLDVFGGRRAVALAKVGQVLNGIVVLLFYTI